MPEERNDNGDLSAGEAAPDGSWVRPLTRSAGASSATFHLPADVTTRAVYHRTVEEHWCVVSGTGRLWIAEVSSASPTHTEGDRTPLRWSQRVLAPGVTAYLPVGAVFQFQAETDLVVFGVTVPAWPGDDEAVVVDGPHEPTVSAPVRSAGLK